MLFSKLNICLQLAVLAQGLNINPIQGAYPKRLLNLSPFFALLPYGKAALYQPVLNLFTDRVALLNPVIQPYLPSPVKQTS